MSQSAKVYFGSIVKENQIPVVIPVEKLSSNWQNGNILYAFTNEYCCKLDMMSDEFRGKLGLETDLNEGDCEFNIEL